MSELLGSVGAVGTLAAVAFGSRATTGLTFRTGTTAGLAGLTFRAGAAVAEPRTAFFDGLVVGGFFFGVQGAVAVFIEGLLEFGFAFFALLLQIGLHGFAFFFVQFSVTVLVVLLQEFFTVEAGAIPLLTGLAGTATGTLTGLTFGARFAFAATAFTASTGGLIAQLGLNGGAFVFIDPTVTVLVEPLQKFFTIELGTLTPLGGGSLGRFFVGHH